MKKILLLLPLITLLSCSIKKDESFRVNNNDAINNDVVSSLPVSQINYNKEVRPILDNRCVVCHGCYDSPCQLKLTSIEGIKRGATKKVVYDGSRITQIPPTRLGVDHKSIEEWRAEEFHPVILETEHSNPYDNLENSLLFKFLQLKEKNPQPKIGLTSREIDISLNRKLYCPNREEFTNFERLHKELGMPFALPNISTKQFYTLSHWIAQGTNGSDDREELKSTLSLIKKFEHFLNKKDLKSRLVARYIYEHLFLGHISFDEKGDTNFYRLVRSNTKTGEIDENSALRPYDDPKQDIYYRFKLYKASIVAKSHTLYRLNTKKFKRFNELFIKPNYKVTHFPSYSAEVASNPFKSFKQIPVKSRYKFLLDDSRFFIEGFIKGPVCRGQIALNVIEDRFWVFFLSPEANILANKDNYIAQMDKYLNLPAEEESKFEFLSLWTKYWKQQKKYLTNRNEQFSKVKSLPVDEAVKLIWDGEKSNPNSALTVFRHLDSASVREGLIGKTPETTWVLNYPIFERIHYLLVAGFNVYGNVSHQLKTRIYMDFLRMEGEEIFLSLIPPKERKELHTAWYGGNRNHLKFFSEEDLSWLNKDFVVGLKSDNKKEEILTHLKDRVSSSIRLKKMTIPKKLAPVEEIKGEPLRYFPEIILLKYQNNAYTLTHNKEYMHVSFFLSDATDRDHRDIENDNFTIVKGFEGTYPNLFINLKDGQEESFINDISTISTRSHYDSFISKYSIRRTSSNFWEFSDWFNSHYKEVEPLRSGILDLNRYN